MLNPQRTLNCRGRLLSLEDPVVMGILNATPDSFFDGGRYPTDKALMSRVEQMLSEGAVIIDVGGMSSRPGASIVEEEEEKRRVLPVIEAIARRFPEAILSVDTIRASVARSAVEAGGHLVNDISAGRLDDAMYETVADLGVPYILMHMQGTPKTMQQQPVYEEIVGDILDFFTEEVGKLRDRGVKDIILDPGFGFGKTITHNYRLLKYMHVFKILDIPVLAGISRKGMIYKLLGSTPEEALNGTTALHMVALQQGASILRAHDVRQAVEVIRCWKQLESV